VEILSKKLNMSQNFDFLLAIIPVFDWPGASFLTFYAIAFMGLTIWSVSQVRKDVREFQIPSPVQPPIDPYELAYLAGGAPRVTQLAVVRLLFSGALKWNKGIFGSHLQAGKPVGAGHLPSIERRLLERVVFGKSKGIPVTDACYAVQSEMRALEVKLASAGLRPTSEERYRRSIGAVMPLILLLLVGIIKVCIGLSRDKPVLFLIGFMVITLIAICIIASKMKRLTPAGEEVLKNLREDHVSKTRQYSAAERDTLPTVSHGLALLGVTSLATSPLFADIYLDLKTRLTQNGSAADSGGCSSSSSSSSGCGGGGCGGGCGGCGGGD
jgi:uncharacterized protein (TIGR04222 family)